MENESRGMCTLSDSMTQNISADTDTYRVWQTSNQHVGIVSGHGSWVIEYFKQIMVIKIHKKNSK